MQDIQDMQDMQDMQAERHIGDTIPVRNSVPKRNLTASSPVHVECRMYHVANM